MIATKINSRFSVHTQKKHLSCSCILFGNVGMLSLGTQNINLGEGNQQLTSCEPSMDYRLPKAHRIENKNKKVKKS